MPNVNVDQDLHQLLQSRAAAEGIPLHRVLNEVLRTQLNSRPITEYVPIGRRRREDLKRTEGQNLVWLLVWRDSTGTTWRAPVRTKAVHTSSVVVEIEGYSAFAVTLDSIEDLVEAFPEDESARSQADFAQADARARGAYMAWRNSGVRAVQARHIWSNVD